MAKKVLSSHLPREVSSDAGKVVIPFQVVQPRSGAFAIHEGKYVSFLVRLCRSR
jgi:hypothetical protein